MSLYVLSHITVWTQGRPLLPALRNSGRFLTIPLPDCKLMVTILTDIVQTKHISDTTFRVDFERNMNLLFGIKILESPGLFKFNPRIKKIPHLNLINTSFKGCIICYKIEILGVRTQNWCLAQLKRIRYNFCLATECL